VMVLSAWCWVAIVAWQVIRLRAREREGFERMSKNP
jgi:hypothetical protein